MRRPFAVLLAAALAASTSASAAAQELRLDPPPPESGRFRLGDVSLLPGEEGGSPPRPGLFDRRTVLVTGGLLLTVPVAGYFLWWRSHKATSFHVGHEGYFGRNTYAGGADKVSHFVFNGIAQHALQKLYEDLGHPPSDARWLAFGATVVGGLIVETGDGFKYGGFSWEDISANTAGALSEAGIASATARFPLASPTRGRRRATSPNITRRRSTRRTSIFSASFPGCAGIPGPPASSSCRSPTERRGTTTFRSASASATSGWSSV
jgi:predicted lipoprotein DUF2279